LAKGPVIDLSNLPEDLQVAANSERSVLTRTSPLTQGQSSHETNLTQIEKNVIEQTLKRMSGNKSLAAKKLGISRRTLYRKLSEYRIDV